MPTVSPVLLDRILARLPLADALELSVALEPPWRARQRRLDARDDLVRQELASAPGASLTALSAAMERRLRRAAAGNATGDEVAARILALNGAKPIGWKQLSKIARDRRTPELPFFSDGNAQLASSDSQS